MPHRFPLHFSGQLSAEYEYDAKAKGLRLFLPVKIASIPVKAVLDTGGLFFMCDFETAQKIRESSGGTKPSKNQMRIGVRGQSCEGELVPTNLSFSPLSGCGEELHLEVTAFLPLTEEDWPSGTPCIAGLQGCLDTLRFAIEGLQSREACRFYFGGEDQG